MRKKFNKKALSSLTMLGVGLFLIGCYPNSSRNVQDFDTVTTYHNSTDVDYGAYTKFAIMDSVLKPSPDEDGEWVNNKGVFDQQIISRVKEQMEARGYVYEVDPQNNGTDLKIICKVSSSTTHVIYSYYPGYGGCYYCGGWYYPWYPVTNVASYSEGSVIVDMTDPANVDPGTGAEAAIWTAVVNGLLSGSDSGKSQRIDEGIIQAYTQSPYLLRNQ